MASSKRFSRRTFMKGVGAATSLAALPMLEGVASAQTRLPVRTTAATALVLMPEATPYAPDLAANWLNGLRLGFAQSLPSGGRAWQVESVRSAGYSGAKATALTSALARRPDLVIDFDRPQLAAGIDAIINQQQVPYLVAGLSAQYGALATNPLVATHGLELWQAAWALGGWTVQRYGLRVASVQSFYESGFDLGYAFECGVVQAGGEIVRRLVSNIPGASSNAQDLQSELAALRPDAVYMGFSAIEGEAWLEAWHTGPLAKTPMVTASLLFEGTGLQRYGLRAAGVQVAGLWAANAGDSASQTFVKRYYGAYGVMPDSGALLGYEAALRVCAASAQLGGNLRDPLAVAEAVRSAKASSPRGSLGADAALTSIVLNAVQLSNGQPQLKTVAVLDGAGAQVGLQSLVGAEIRSGWAMMYGC